MTMKHLLLIFLAASTLTFSGCREDDNNPNNNPSEPSYANPYLSGASVQHTFSGRIMNQQGEAIAGAAVQVAAVWTVSNAQGFYQLSATVDKEFASVKVIASGYFDQVRSFKPALGHEQRSDIRMIPRQYNADFDASTGAEIEVPGGGKVTFPANAVATMDGNPYAGQVSIASVYLDPTDPYLPTYMPGSLAAVGSDGVAIGMITYGMIGLEMYASNGQSLQLADGQTASIEFPVQGEQMGHAPDRIPLWFFDEESGLWREDGFADKAGDVYVGTVSHFTFWNCDVAVQTFNLEGTLVTDQGQGIANLLVRVIRPNGSAAGTSSNSDGYFSGIVPANEVLILQVLHPNCDMEVTLYETEIGPNSTDTDLGEIVLDLSGTASNISFSGLLVDCDEQALADYFIIYTVEGVTSKYLNTNADGGFSFPLICVPQGNIELVAFDFENMAQSTAFTLSFNEQDASAFDFGNLSFCESVALENYFIYDEGDHNISHPTVTISEAALEIPGCTQLSVGINGTFDSTAVNLYFIVPSIPGPAFTCGGQNGIISHYFPDSNLSYQALLNDTQYIITDFTEEGGVYTMIEGTFTTEVEVLMFNNNIQDAYLSTASGSFRFTP
jgi:hypothetical protein